MVKRSYDDLIITVGALALGWGIYNIITNTTRSYAVVAPPCAAACAPFKSSPATYATCCKQHAANTPKPVAAKPAVVKSKLPKPPSTGALQQGHMTFYDKIGNSPLFSGPGTGPVNLLRDPQPTYKPPQKITNYNYNYTAPPTPTNQTSTTPRGGDSQTVGCTPGQYPSAITQGWTISNTESHGQKSHPGAKIPREESRVDQPGGNFKYSTIVSIPSDEKPDDVTIEFDGGEHHDCDTRNGHKVMISVAGGDGKAGFYTQVGCDYGDPSDSFGYNLERGKTYGIVVVNQVVGNDVVSNLYIQNISDGESNAKLIVSHTTLGGAAYAAKSGNRIGNRIDNIKGGGPLITKCVKVG